MRAGLERDSSMASSRSRTRSSKANPPPKPKIRKAGRLEPTDPELEAFLALLAARRAKRTVDAYRRDLTELRTRLGHPVASAATDELEHYVAELRAEGLSAATIARRVAAARSFYRHLVLLG